MCIKLQFIVIGFAFAFCIADVKGMEKENCFLYPLDGNTSSSTFDLRDDIRITLYYPYDYRRSFVKIMDKDDCIFGIYNRKEEINASVVCLDAITVNTPRCNLRITKEENRWKLEIYGPGIPLEKVFSLKSDIKTISLKGPTQDSISYYVDCHNDCFDFEKASLIQNKYHEISLFGCKIDPMRKINTTLKVVHESNTNGIIKNETTYLGGYWNSFNPSDRCFHVHFRFEFRPGNFHDLYAFIAPDYKPQLLAKDVFIRHPHLSFDFNKTSNIRWSLCQPEQFPGSISIGVSILFVYITVPAIGFLFLTSAAMAILLWKSSRIARSQSEREVNANTNQAQAVRLTQEQNRDRSNKDPDELIRHQRDHEYDNPDGVIRPISEHIYEEIPIVVYDDVTNRGNRDRQGLRRQEHETRRTIKGNLRKEHQYLEVF